MTRLFRFFFLALLYISLPDSILAQEVRQGDWTTIHMLGFSFEQSTKTLNEMTGNENEDIKYRINSIGAHYSSFSGSRLGFVSDLNLLIPLQTEMETESAEKSSGFIVDYLGGVGWNLRAGQFGFIPAAGFHADYSYLSKDPIDEDMANHMISFGLGLSLKVLYEFNENHHLYTGIRGTINTIEFSSASYDSREIRMKRKLSYLISAGYAWSL